MHGTVPLATRRAIERRAVKLRHILALQREFERRGTIGWAEAREFYEATMFPSYKLSADALIRSTLAGLVRSGQAIMVPAGNRVVWIKPSRRHPACETVSQSEKQFPETVSQNPLDRETVSR